MRRLRRLHRYIGALAALFTLWLAVSGLLLQHGPDLALHQRFVTQPWVLAWYGVRVDEQVRGYRLRMNSGTAIDVVQLDDRIFVGRARLPVEDALLRGAIVEGDDIIVALADALLRVSPPAAEGGAGSEAQVLDRAGGVEGVPTPLTRIGRDGAGSIVVDTPTGRSTISADFLELSPHAGTGVRWSTSAALPAPDDATAAAYLDGLISYERLLADLHTGRLGGSLGPWVIDASAVALIVLALSGLWLFARTR